MVATKIIKSGGSEPDEFEKTVSQALLELELNSELKPQLRDLHITRARELEFATKKVCSNCKLNVVVRCQHVLLNIHSLFLTSKFALCVCIIIGREIS